MLNAADFGDLLLECIRLFREQPEVLRQYQERFRYILVDEYQDTNVAQYLWLRLLGQSTARAAANSVTSPRLRGEVRPPTWRVGCRVTGLHAPSSWRAPHPTLSRNGEREHTESRRATCARRTAAHAQEHLLRRRRRPVDLRLARRRGRQHPALRARLSRRQDHPPRAQLPQHRPHPRRRLAPDRPQRGPARQDAAHRGRAGREGAGHLLLGFRGRGARDRRGDRGSCSATTATAGRIRSTRSPSWCAPRSRCASSRIASSRSACPIG